MAARVATIAVATAVPLMAAAGPALALHRDDGDVVNGPSLGAGLTLFYFVVIPVGVFAIIAALALLPSALSRPRYRPGKTWEHGTKWFGKPADGEAAAAEGSARGGASAEW
jgi:hypothetical protein